MRILLIITFVALFFAQNAISESPIVKGVEKTKDSLLDTINAQKYIYRSSKKSKKQLEDALQKINIECCEKNFNEITKLNKIKLNIEKCLNDNCHKYNMPLFNRKKPPLKLVVLRSLDNLDDLFMSNEKQKYDNLILEQKNTQNSVLLKNEKDIEIVKKSLEKAENENLKLKKTVNKMLINYQKKISDLEMHNQKLETNFNLVFEAHSKNRQKKLQKNFK